MPQYMLEKTTRNPLDPKTWLELYVTLLKVSVYVADKYEMLATRMTPTNVPTMSPSKSWPYFDPEYDTMSSLIDPPRYVFLPCAYQLNAL